MSDSQKEKHLVYAEDILYEIMQHPHKTLTKRDVHSIIREVTEKKQVSIGSIMPIG